MTTMIKKRSRPQHATRWSFRDGLNSEEEKVGENGKGGVEEENEEVKGLPLADLIELRKLRKARQGIDASKLIKGDVKKKRRKPQPDGTMEQGGLRVGADGDQPAEDSDDENEDAAGSAGRTGKTNRMVKTNNFTQQTNTLDVDKHMMAYIEESMKLLKGTTSHSSASDVPPEPVDPHEELYRLSGRWKAPPPLPPPGAEAGVKERNRGTPKNKDGEEGNVTNSLSMLTAIPEVDLGMDTRLRNIEETEKAKRMAAEAKQGRKRTKNDEEHLAASRFYRPHLKQKSDSDIMRDAKLEALGMPASDDQSRKQHHERTQVATDEIVMERFKKRMRK